MCHKGYSNAQIQYLLHNIILQIPSEANPAGIIDFFPMFKAKVLPADYVIREGDT